MEMPGSSSARCVDTVSVAQTMRMALTIGQRLGKVTIVKEVQMWAIMIINSRGWHTHSQETNLDEAERVAMSVNGAIVPWEDRLYLLDNGLIEKEIQWPMT